MKLRLDEVEFGHNGKDSKFCNIFLVYQEIQKSGDDEEDKYLKHYHDDQGILDESKIFSFVRNSIDQSVSNEDCKEVFQTESNSDFENRLKHNMKKIRHKLGVEVENLMHQELGLYASFLIVDNPPLYKALQKELFYTALMNKYHKVANRVASLAEIASQLELETGSFMRDFIKA